MEFEEAQDQGRPTLMFEMGDQHPIKSGDVELDPDKREKLQAFRERAKEARIRIKFQSLKEFEREVFPAVAKLKLHLENLADDVAGPPETAVAKTVAEKKAIPVPPEFYSEPSYLGSHEFVGRRAELDTLNDWALPSDSHPMLLFEAIGGTGKSMLTWEWVRHHAAEIRDDDQDWAGRFWYSFYEKGARLESFCRHALAYMTGQPLDSFGKKKTPELSVLLLAELRAKPWLIVFDGIERILVAYSRFDAAELSDEAAEEPEDKIADRDPSASIRPEDDELLKALSAASPSTKLLLTPRIIPRALLNAGNVGIPGVLHERLKGLRPADAEALLGSPSCGNITGDSASIRSFLQRDCGCHPLVIGVLAGLINQAAPWRGDFDAWQKAPEGGGELDLADLNLIQKGNHILESALKMLPEKGHALLATLALLSKAADGDLLRAVNPHAADADALDAENLLWETVADLEARSFLQYDRNSKRYDLHPVVRGVVAG